MIPLHWQLLGLLTTSALFCVAPTSRAQEFPRVPNPPGNLANLPGDLRKISVPEPANLSNFVKDRAAAIQLGKALFWDMQVGSDGIQACASCHFRAGADPRSKNQLSPGLKSVPTSDTTFFPTSGPNYQLQAVDFPFRRLSDPRNRLSVAVHDNNDVVSSQGVHFLALAPGGSQFLPDPQGFRVGSSNTRRVEPRNTPSVINAVFYESPKTAHEWQSWRRSLREIAPLLFKN